jgi:hypothetical protein
MGIQRRALRRGAVEPGGDSLSTVTDTLRRDVARLLARVATLEAGGVGVPASRTIATTSPLTGGGTLAADRTLALPAATAAAAGHATAAQITKLDGIASGATTGRIYTSGTALTIGSTSSATTFASFPIPAGTLGSTGAIDIAILGTYLNNDFVTRTLTLSFLLHSSIGDATMYTCVSGAIAADSATHPFLVRLRLAAAGATNAQFLCGSVLMGAPGTATTGLGDMSAAITASNGINAVVAGSVAVDSTAAMTFTAKSTHSSASPNVVLTIKHVAALRL